MAVFNSLFLIHLLHSTTARQLNGHEHECPPPDCPAPVPGCTTRANPAAMDRHGCLADPCGWRECAFFSGPAAPRWGHAEVVWRPGADAAEGARLQAAVDRAADVWRRGSAAPFTVLARFAAATAALSAPLSVQLGSLSHCLWSLKSLGPTTATWSRGGSDTSLRWWPRSLHTKRCT